MPASDRQRHGDGRPVLRPAWPAALLSGTIVALAAAAGPSTGTGTGGGPAGDSPPATVDEARARWAEAQRLCAQHPVRAVRQECLRLARQEFECALSRLQAPAAGGSAPAAPPPRCP